MTAQTLTGCNATSVIAVITPDRAKQMLKTSGGNRSLKAAKVDALCRDMSAGKYRLNGQSIIFSESGRLMDGHHRLTACAKSGATITSVVVHNIEDDAGKTQDTGSSRTNRDHLALKGYKNSNNLSAIISILMSLERGRPRSENPSSSEVFDFVENHPSVHESASFAATKAYPRSGNIMGAIHFVAEMCGDLDKVIQFRDVFATGIPAYEGCPAHLLRERLNKRAIRGEKLPTASVHRLFIAAWEKFREGKSAKTLKAPDKFSITGWRSTHS